MVVYPEGWGLLGLRHSQNWEGRLTSNRCNLVGPLGSGGTRVSPRSTDRASADGSGVHGRGASEISVSKKWSMAQVPGIRGMSGEQSGNAQ